MLRTSLTILCLAMAANAHAQDAAVAAQGVLGVNDDGDCVRPCTRAGGRPCRPCFPVVGPGDKKWSTEVDQTALANELFGSNIRRLAQTDREYRASPAFKEDRKVYRNVAKSVQAMRSVGAQR